MHARERRALQDTLTAIRLKTSVAEAGYALHPNGERHLRPLETLRRVYPPAWLAETLAIAERCHFSLDELRYEYPEEIVPPGETPTVVSAPADRGRLRAALPGRRRARRQRAKVRKLIEHELALIAEVRYEPFFLTVYDIVEFAREQKILCQGRGSAANSAVCYCLGITAVDPSRMEMLFERFISRERNEPPDIDVDFEHQRREEVIQYIYGKYGRERAALAATVICYRPRARCATSARRWGSISSQVDRLAKSMTWWDGRRALPQRVQEAGFDPTSAGDAAARSRWSTSCSAFPRHLSQHVGGFVISRGPLVRAGAGRERRDARAHGDPVGQGRPRRARAAQGRRAGARHALGDPPRARSRRARDAAHHSELTDVPAEDPAVYEMICHGDTVGVFQIESRAQMAMLPRLKPQSFYDLVIEVAIVRPGPIQGGMVHPYLRRRQGMEPVDYPSEAVKGVLERTLGVPIFQEQVMQLAIVAAGFTPGEADQLRRSMAAWKRKGGLEHFERQAGRRHARARLRAKRSPSRSTSRSWASANTAFPESHSASFALLVYVSAWLKHHEPAAFACALLNSQPMGFYSPSQLVQDLRRHDVPILPADVTVSEWDCTLEGSALPARALPRQGFLAGRRRAHGRGAPRAGLRRRRRSCAARQPERARHAGAGRRRRAASLSGHRRDALWDVAGVERMPPLLADAPFDEAKPALARARAKARTSSPTTRAWDSRWAVIRSRCCASACSASAWPTAAELARCRTDASPA